MTRLFLILYMLFFLGMGAYSGEINVEKLNFELGTQSLKENRLDEAVRYFLLVIDKNPDNVEARYNLAVAYKKLGEHKKALQHFNIVVKLLNTPEKQGPELVRPSNAPEDFDTYTRVKAKENDYIDLGDMHADSARYKEAIEYYNIALRLNPYNDNTYFKIFNCYKALDDHFNAAPYITRALELDPDNPRYTYYKDKIKTDKRIARKNLNEADPVNVFADNYYEKQLFNEEPTDNISDKPSQEMDYLELGDLHFDNQDYTKAIEYYNLASQANSGNDYTYYKLARSYIELEQYEKADNYIKKAISLAGEVSKYVYFRNLINDRQMPGYTGAPDFYIDEIVTEPEEPQKPHFPQKTEHTPIAQGPSLFDRIKSAISFKMPDIPDIKVPNIKMPTLQGKVEKAEKPKEKQDNSIFNRDLERYKISETPKQTEYTREQHSPNIYNDKGIEFFRRNNLEKAENYFKKAIELKPMFPKGYNNLANVEFKRGNLEKAKAYALKSVEIDPEFAEGYYNLGLISKKQGDFESELYYLNRAIAANPKYYQAYFTRGLAYYNRGNYEKAKYNFSEVLTLKNDHYMAAQNLGIIYANELNYEQAEKYLKHAVKLNKDNSRSYFYLGFVQQNSDKIAESIESLQKAIQLDSSAYRYYISLSKGYNLNNQPEKALETLQTAAERNPENAEIFNYLGLANLNFGDYKDACRAFHAATLKNPNRSIYHYNLSQCYLSLGNRKASNLEFQRAVNTIPVTVQDYIDLAEIFFDRGMASYAIKTLKDGTSQLPDSDYLYLVLSDFYERTGAKNAASRVLEEYLEKREGQTKENSFVLLIKKRLNELGSPGYTH